MDEGFYGLCFILKENGVYYLDIKLNDYYILDSFFVIMVGFMVVDFVMVFVYGDGLERGLCGIKLIKVF